MSNSAMVDPAEVLRLAGELKKSGHYAEAEQVLDDLIEQHPTLVPAYNNLGTIYYAQKKYAEAIVAFRHAIDLQADYIDAYYNLGLSLAKYGDIDNALVAFTALEEITEGHPGGQFHSGCLYMIRGRYAAAIERFLAMEKLLPDHPEMHSNLASCYLHLNKLHEAMQHYHKALLQLTHDTQILFNLGVIYMKLGRVKEAVQYYLQVVDIDSLHHAAHHNLGVAYLALQDAESALLHFRAAVLAKPDNVATRHTVNLLEHKPGITASPKEYVASLFDSYADYYEAHVLYTLHYLVPQAMYDLLAEYVPLKEKAWDVLDIGCGTGLSGDVFKPLAKTLVGVDLSPKMLEVAKDKNIYTVLDECDAVAYLERHIASFDLILAGDVVVYFGEVEQLMAAVCQSLRVGGYYIFSAEISQTEDYLLSPSGRFSHARQYLDAVASSMALQVIHYQEITLRTQNDMPVAGHLYLLKKVNSH